MQALKIKAVDMYTLTEIGASKVSSLYIYKLEKTWVISLGLENGGYPQLEFKSKLSAKYWESKIIKFVEKYGTSKKNIRKNGVKNV